MEPTTPVFSGIRLEKFPCLFFFRFVIPPLAAPTPGGLIWRADDLPAKRKTDDSTLLPGEWISIWQQSGFLP